MKNIALVTICLFCTIELQAQDIDGFVNKQLQTYPQLRLLDLYKSCFQDYMGAEHLVSDRQRVKAYLDDELNTISIDDLMPWNYEPCGIDSNYYRVSIRTIKESVISEDLLLDAFIRSANSKKRPTVDSWRDRWHVIIGTIDKMQLELPYYQQDKAFIDSILSVGRYAISHSPEYREAYHPHYRIVERGIFERELKPLIEHKYLQNKNNDMDDNPRERLWQAFLTPPDSIRVGCYYYWVNEQVDPKGVVADLEWMKENGITLAFLATDIRNRTTWDNPWEGQAFGKNKFQSRLWWKNLRTALKTAGRLGIEMGLFNCPGWSQSGGPWVKPEEAMRNWTSHGIEVCKTKEGTDVMCSPCSPDAQGLEVDKLSKVHVQKHFEAFIGEILRRIPQKDRPTLTTVVVDSWERGKQNYTDSIFSKFRQRFGYELDYTNPACQKDLDRLIADLVASEYMGGLTEKAHEYGLRTWCEPYAHSPFPANSITYGSAADEVAAEFWVDDRKFRQKEVDAALGSARRSGKNRVWAESFTDGWPELAKDDWSFEKLKPIADRYFHAGINASILHVMISQPGNDRKPAVRPWFGTYFDRRSQHASDLKPLVTYLRRCNFMLQLGKPLDGANDRRILNDGTKIRFTEESLFEVTFPDGHQELWNPMQGITTRGME